MPELPEVETVRAGLASKIIGARVVDVSISDARSLKRHVLGPKHFVDELLGQCLLAVVRRGKFLWLPLSDSISHVCTWCGVDVVRGVNSDTPCRAVFFVVNAAVAAA